MARSYVRGLDGRFIASTLKHFPGCGEAQMGPDGFPVLDKDADAMMAFEAMPFVSAIHAGADAVVVGHVQCPKASSQVFPSASAEADVTLPASLSSQMVDGFLRGEMGFSGLVMSAPLRDAALTAHFDVIDAAVLAVNAGVDMLLDPIDASTEEGLRDLAAFVDALVEKVHAGEISEEVVERAAGRILLAKARRDIIEGSLNGNVEDRITVARSSVGGEQHRAEAQEMAAACAMSQ